MSLFKNVTVAPLTHVVAENQHLLSIMLLDDQMVVSPSHHTGVPGHIKESWTFNDIGNR